MSLGNKLRGFLFTVNTLGFHTALREAVRRTFGISYTWKGIPVDSTILFKLLRKLVSSGYKVYGSEERLWVKTYFGEVGVDIQDYSLLNVLLEPLEEIYGCADVNGGVVVDIGAYIGRLLYTSFIEMLEEFTP